MSASISEFQKTCLRKFSALVMFFDISSTILWRCKQKSVKENFQGFQRLNGRTEESYRSEKVKKTPSFDDLFILKKKKQNSALTLVNVAPLSIKVH